MSDDSQNDNEKKGEFRLNPRGILLWIAIIGAVFALMYVKNNQEQKPQKLTYSELTGGIL